MKSVQIVFSLAAGGVTFLGVFLYSFYKRHRRYISDEPSIEDWQYAGTLEEIIMYPIKSCGGIELKEAVCKKNGIKCGGLEDRQLILIDDEDKLIGVNEIEVTAPEMEPLVLNIHKLTNGRKEIIKKFERSSILLIECDSQYGNWFSKYLLEKETGLKLFNFNAYMVMVDESIKDLNARLPNKVHHWQFRGNFLINNSQLPAFSEDNWKWMRIGYDAIFRYKAPCYRCILPKVNPFTCERSTDFEPLRILKKYRMKPGQVEPEMGIYFHLYREGSVKLGDEVFVVI